jgi:hypothetical protein
MAYRGVASQPGQQADARAVMDAARGRAFDAIDEAERVMAADLDAL